MKADDVKKALTPDYLKDEITYEKAFAKVREYADITEETVTKEELDAEAAKAAEEAKTEEKPKKTRAKKAKTEDGSEEPKKTTRKKKTEDAE